MGVKKFAETQGKVTVELEVWPDNHARLRVLDEDGPEKPWAVLGGPVLEVIKRLLAIHLPIPVLGSPDSAPPG